MPHSSHRDARPILLTGASGVVGAALVEELSDRPVICLTHRQPVPGAVAQVHGDLNAPLLGMSRQRYEALAAQIGTIVHCAAVTDFGAGPQATHALNVRGTEHILALTQRSDAVLHYVSTAFVSRRDLTRPGTSSDAGTTTPGHYLDSKRAAEQLVLDSGVPATIVRPSVVIGDSTTGEIVRFQGLHTIAGAIMRNTLPMVPLSAQATVDFLPQDLVARAVAGLVRSGTSAGEFWVTAGRQALTSQRMVELAVDTARRLGLAVDAPRLVDPDIVDRLIRPVFIDPLPAPDRLRFDGLLAMAALFSTATPFESCLDSIPGVRPPTPDDLEDAFVASLTYYAHAKGLLVRSVAA